MADNKEIVRGLQATLMVDNREVIRGLQTTLGRMEIALGAIREAILWTSEEGTIIWCNKSFDNMVGLPHISILGANVVDVFPLENESGPIPIDQHPCQKLRQASIIKTSCIFKPNNNVWKLEDKGRNSNFAKPDRTH